MFWKFNLLTTSHIDTLLDKEDVTLHELMEEDDILQECKAQNRKLITFLVLPENMEELVKLITDTPEDDMDEKLKYKYPNTACELLTSDVSQINDGLAGSEDLVNKLYSFLDTDQTLNPLLASFFSKVMGLLITRKSEMILDFLKSREDFVGTLLRHIGTSAIMDLLLRLLTCIESPEIKRAMIEWLNDEKIVKKLVHCITPSYDEDIHCNAAQSLCDIIRLGREQVIQPQDRTEPDPLLTTVELEETVTELLDNMLAAGDKNESVIINGLSVIQTLLEFKKQGPEDSVEQMRTLDVERMFQGVNNVLTAICPRLKDFHSILVDPPKQRYCVMPSSAGQLEPPLGNTRLQTGRLIASLLLTNTHSINVQLTQLGTINVLLDLYFKYIWNNFLHTHVTQCLYTILNNPSIEVEGKKETPLLDQLFTDVKLIEKIIEEWESNDEHQSKEGGKRKGFMGHLTRMANDIVVAQEKGENTDTVKSLIEKIPEETKEKWETFLTGTLAETNKRNTVETVRGHALASSSEDDEADFSNIPFPQDTAMQQLQQMTSNFIDQFGFNEEEFGEQEEKTDSPFTDRISSIDFGVSVNEDTRPNSSMFEQSCNERLQQFDNDSDEDIWEEKEITFSPNTQQAKRSERLAVSRGSHGSDDSTDSEEELDSPKHIKQQPGAPAEDRMDIDSNEAWTANFDQQTGVEAGPIAMDTSPWDSKEASQSGQSDEKWADFANKIPTDAEKDESWAEFNKEADKNSKENWADFRSFTNLKRDEATPRSSSPVAMDTTETTNSSRTNAYLAENKEMDLKLESVDIETENIDTVSVSTTTVSSDSDKDTNTQSSTTNTGPNTPSDKTDNIDSTQTHDNHSQSQSNDKDDVNHSTLEQDTDNKTQNSENQSKTPEPSESSVGDSPPTPPSCPPPDDSETLPSTPPASPRTPPVHNTDSESTTPPDSVKSPADKQGQGDGFLTKVGLMRPATQGVNCTDTATVNDTQIDIQGNGLTGDDEGTSVDKIEELRSQAKDALENFDSAIATGASVQNGPV